MKGLHIDTGEIQQGLGLLTGPSTGDLTHLVALCNKFALGLQVSFDGEVHDDVATSIASGISTVPLVARMITVVIDERTESLLREEGRPSALSFLADAPLPLVDHQAMARDAAKAALAGYRFEPTQRATIAALAAKAYGTGRALDDPDVNLIQPIVRRDTVADDERHELFQRSAVRGRRFYYALLADVESRSHIESLLTDKSEAFLLEHLVPLFNVFRLNFALLRGRYLEHEYAPGAARFGMLREADGQLGRPWSDTPTAVHEKAVARFSFSERALPLPVAIRDLIALYGDAIDTPQEFVERSIEFAEDPHNGSAHAMKRNSLEHLQDDTNLDEIAEATEGGVAHALSRVFLHDVATLTIPGVAWAVSQRLLNSRQRGIAATAVSMTTPIKRACSDLEAQAFFRKVFGHGLAPN